VFITSDGTLDKLDPRACGGTGGRTLVGAIRLLNDAQPSRPTPEPRVTTDIIVMRKGKDGESGFKGEPFINPWRTWARASKDKRGRASPSRSRVNEYYAAAENALGERTLAGTCTPPELTR